MGWLEKLEKKASREITVAKKDEPEVTKLVRVKECADLARMSDRELDVHYERLNKQPYKTGSGQYPDGFIEALTEKNERFRLKQARRRREIAENNAAAAALEGDEASGEMRRDNLRDANGKRYTEKPSI